MKYLKLYLLSLFWIASIAAYAQEGLNGFRYQAVLAETSTGLPISNKGIIVEATIDLNGSSMYVEEHVTQTDDLGRFSITIGKGEASSSILFNGINWSSGVHSLSLTVDTSAVGSGPLFTFGPDTFYSVPFAQFAKQVSGTVVCQTELMAVTSISSVIPWTPAPLSAVVLDTDSGYNTASNQYKVPHDGVYFIQSHITTTGPDGLSVKLRIINTTTSEVLDQFEGGGNHKQVSTIVSLSKDTHIRIEYEYPDPGTGSTLSSSFLRGEFMIFSLVRN